MADAALLRLYSLPSPRVLRGVLTGGATQVTSPGASVELCSCPSLNHNLSHKSPPSSEGMVNVLPCFWQGQAELAVTKEGAVVALSWVAGGFVWLLAEAKCKPCRCLVARTCDADCPSGGVEQEDGT